MATFTMYFKDVLDAEPSIESDVLANYPLFDEGYRPWLNQQIKDQFWNREIGQETISVFKLALKRKLNQIMPLYNQHYLASQVKIDPLQTMSVKNVMRSNGDTSSTSTGKSVSESDSGSESVAVATDYPQTGRTEDGRYASSGQESKSTSRANGEAAEESNTSSSQAETRDGETVGSTGHAAMLLFQYRQTLVNVDLMVLDELETLFMLLWDNGDEFTQRGYYGFGY